MSETWVTIRGVVVQGHQVASRKSEHYPRGTIEMQLPFFQQLGLDLTPFYQGTLNVSISPHIWTMKHPPYTFRDVRWTSAHPPEHFSFSRCRVTFESVTYDGWIYYPHPETKQRHFQNPSIVEIIASRIPHIGYGDRVEVEVNTAEVLVGEAGS